MKKPAVLFAQGLIALVYALLAAFWEDSEVAALVGVCMLAVSLVLLLIELQPLLQQENIPDLRLWQLVAVSVAMWMLARVYEAGAIAMTGSYPTSPTVADLVRLAGFLAVLGGLSIWPVSRGRRFRLMRDLLDVLIIMGGSFVLFYLTVIQSALEVGIDRPVMIIWAGLPPAFDITLILLALRLCFLAGSQTERNYFSLITLAFVLRLPSDLAIGYGLVRPDRISGQLSDLGWLLSPMALVIATSLRKRVIDPSESYSDVLSSRWNRLAARTEALLPVSIAYLVAGFTVVDYWLMGQLDPVAAVSTALLGLLLVARQGVIAGQAEMRQHAALVNAAADLAFICDNNGQVLLANPALRIATGVEPSNKSRVTLADLLVEDRAEQIVAKSAEGGWSGQVQFLNAKGHPFPVALSMRPVPDERNYQVMLAGTAHDLTALMQREDDLRQALAEVAEARRQLETLNQSLEEKVELRTKELADTVDHLEQLNEELKELDRLKSEFVTLVSHELRGPLTNIRSGVELALSRSDRLDRAAQETLGLVADETERLVSFVEIILDLSALEAGHFPLDLEPIPVSVLCRAVASRFPKGKKNRIHVEIPEGLPPVFADEKALSSVLFHLFDNALKYAPSGPVLVEAERQGNRAVIAVMDHGPGIPREERQAVFDRFHRLDNRDSREIYGHGLGLYLSRQLLNAMDGDIQIGEHESGARVEFWLPLKQSEPAGIAQP